MLAHSFLIESSSKLLVKRTGIKARTSSFSGLWFPWPIYMFFEMRWCQVQLVDDQKICFCNTCLIDHHGLSVSLVLNRLLNQEMSVGKGIMCSYTPGIYAEGYIASSPHLYNGENNVSGLFTFEWFALIAEKTIFAHWSQVSDRGPLGYLYIRSSPNLQIIGLFTSELLALECRKSSYLTMSDR